MTCPHLASNQLKIKMAAAYILLLRHIRKINIIIFQLNTEFELIRAYVTFLSLIQDNRQRHLYL